MDIQSQKQDPSEQTDKEEESAVPYIPPPPPDESSQKKNKSPLFSAVFAAAVILVGGFMTYNLIGHQLTRLSADSVEVSLSPTPSVVPTVTVNP